MKIKAKLKKKNTNKWDDDYYTKLARKENYPARSVYKLKEIDKKFKIFKKGFFILDLGCSPGSWLKYASEKTGEKGFVAGVDLNTSKIINEKNIVVLKGDIFDSEIVENLCSMGLFDVVMSDMAPKTTGCRHTDCARSCALAEASLDISFKTLKKGGIFITKIFQGGDFDSFAQTILSFFEKRKIFKPESCRKNSREIYIIGMGKK
ncbi:MAG: 50S rRNA methyltransferase [Deltaproteobacteria bacterium]|nr:MAG: 50S rRNA methyltransferase [Deltaproteobacteria bacterium]